MNFRQSYTHEKYVNIESRHNTGRVCCIRDTSMQGNSNPDPFGNHNNSYNSSNIPKYAPSPNQEDVPLTKLIVNFLPDTVNETVLYNLFVHYGEIHNVRIMRDADNNPKGFGFVNYVHPESAAEAIQMLNGLDIGHKRIKVGYCRPNSQTDRTNLFVGTIPSEWTEEDLNILFQDYHPLFEVRVLRDEKGNSRNCGFIRLSSIEKAEAAIRALNGRMCQGAAIKVRVAKNRKRGSPVRAPRRQQQGGYSSPSPVMNVMPNQVLYASPSNMMVNQWPSPQPQVAFIPMSSPGNVMYDQQYTGMMFDPNAADAYGSQNSTPTGQRVLFPQMVPAYGDSTSLMTPPNIQYSINPMQPVDVSHMNGLAQDFDKPSFESLDKDRSDVHKVNHMNTMEFIPQQGVDKAEIRLPLVQNLEEDLEQNSVFSQSAMKSFNDDK